MINYLKLAEQNGYIVKIIFPLNNGLLHFPSRLSFEDQKNFVKTQRSGTISGQKKIAEHFMDTMISNFIINIEQLKLINDELVLNMVENIPENWISKIRENFFNIKPPYIS